MESAAEVRSCLREWTSQTRCSRWRGAASRFAAEFPGLGAHGLSAEPVSWAEGARVGSPGVLDVDVHIHCGVVTAWGHDSLSSKTISHKV